MRACPPSEPSAPCGADFQPHGISRTPSGRLSCWKGAQMGKGSLPRGKQATAAGRQVLLPTRLCSECSEDRSHSAEVSGEERHARPPGPSETPFALGNSSAGHEQKPLAP